MAQFYAFRHAAGKNPLEWYVFQVEMIYVATRLGYTFKEVPFHFADRRWGKSKMNFRIQLEAALRVWQLAGLYHYLREKRFNF